MAGCSADPVDPVADDQSTSAEVMCEEFIERRLKAPKTAEYSGTQTAKNGAEYTVSGAVDSENALGVALRSEYTCVVRSDGDDKWTLVDLKLGD
ncbi:hypothetical protein E0H26_11750 [Micromonospora zingiberis]|uniref:Lipoprotein n=1 Tax=Micromonospora zingiberis TaxID=2053011 RepID=A0A4R0GJT0_9ACTN|nr:hypothetical protein E0H26_11750 [Micromonospora zingiberis]